MEEFTICGKEAGAGFRFKNTLHSIVVFALSYPSIGYMKDFTRSGKKAAEGFRLL